MLRLVSWEGLLERRHLSSELFLEPEKVAEIVHAKPKTLANWRSAGCGPEWIKVGRKVLYPADALVSFLKGVSGHARPR